MKSKLIGEAMLKYRIYDIVITQDVRGGLGLTAYRTLGDEIANKGASTILLPNEQFNEKTILKLNYFLNNKGL